MINCIQNKSFCLHNMCMYCVYLLCVYINTHTCMYIFKKNMLCLCIQYKLYEYSYMYGNTCTNVPFIHAYVS